MQQVEKAITEHLESKIRSIPDFPKPGILFKDITPLLKNSDTLQLTSQMLIRPFRNSGVEYIIGLESRGFLFGTGMAQSLNAGFIPVRKPNKLPAETISESYALEYGTDSVEIHKDALHNGAKVIIHDDLIATGGTALAAYKLANKLGAEVIGFSFVMELMALNGRNLLPPGIPIESLIKVN
jgi:adenine phosphoribosyltransferase